MISQLWSAFINWLKTSLDWLKESLAQSEEYAVFRRIFRKLLLFVAIVVLTLMGSGVMAVVKYFFPHATPVLFYLERVIVLADGLLFFGLLAVEVAEGLVKAKLIEESRRRQAAVVIVGILALGAAVPDIKEYVETTLLKISVHLDKSVDPVKPSPSSKLRDYLQQGNTFYFKTDGFLPGNPPPAGCIGSILPNTLYTIMFHAENKSWDGTGNSGDGTTCQTATLGRSVLGGYGCLPSNNGGGLFCKEEYSPSGGAFVLWGETFRFDETGHVTHEKTGQSVGILLKQPN